VNAQPAKPPRRQLYYAAIHLTGHRVVDGVQRYAGMLEADRQVERLAEFLTATTGRSLKGYMIQRVSRKQIRSMISIYGYLKCADVMPAQRSAGPIFTLSG
jgi:hypothetical protein